MSIDLGTAKGYIELDTSSLQSACRGVQKELQKVDRQSELMRSEILKSQEGARKLANSYNSLGQELNAVKEHSKLLSLQMNESKNKLEIYKQGIAGLNNYVSECKSKQKDLKLELEQASKQYDMSKQKVLDLSRTLGKNSDEYKKASQEMSQHQNKLLQLEQNYNNLSDEIEDSEDKIKQFKTQINYAEKEISNLSKQIAINESKFTIMGNTLQSSGDKLKAFSNGANSLGNVLTVGVSAPLTAVATASVKMAMDAETSFAKVSTVVDEATLSYIKLKKDVTVASNETGVAITKFNEALYQSVSAGVDSAKAIGFTTDMVKLAKGGFTEVSNAVDVVTTTLNAYGLEVQKANEISDKLITTQNLGKTTVNELSTTLGRVIPNAKNVNLNFDNVATSMALLTKNGIETSESATYLNSMLNELGKSGTIADKTLKQLTNKGFAQLIESGASMTDALCLLQDEAKKSGKSLSDMFGSAEASKAALTIMKNNGEEYNQILKQMQNSAGATEKAFNKMNNTEFEKFNREINKLKNAGIQAGAKLLPIATKGVEIVGDLATAFSQLSPQQQEAIVKAGMFAIALGPLTKSIGVVTNVVGTATKGIGKLFEKLGNTKNLNKASSSISGLASVLGKINPIAGAVTASVLAVGSGIVFAMNKAKKAMIKADLEKRFGNIKLSAEEVEDIAKRLTTNEFTLKIDAVIDAKEKLDNFKQSIEQLIDNMRKTEWKVSVGLELTEEEKSSYKENIEQYISQTSEYIKQQHYTTTLAIDTILQPNTQLYNQVKDNTDKIYNEINGQLDKLGKELAQVTNKAFEDGILSQDERSLINKKKAEIQKVLDEVAKAKFDVKMDKLGIEASEDGLSVNSFKDLSKQIDKITKEKVKAIEDTIGDTLVTARFRLNAGEISQDEYDKIKKATTIEAEKKIGEIKLNNLDFKISQIHTNYSDVFEKAGSNLEKGLNDMLVKSSSNVDSIMFWNAFTNDFKNAYETSKVKGIAKDSLCEIIKQLQPDEQQLYKTAQKYYELGEIPPKNIIEGLKKIEQTKAFTGEVSNMYLLMADEIANSPELERVVSTAIQSGNEIPQGLAESLKNNYGLVYNATSGIFESVDKTALERKEVIKKAFEDIGFSASSALIEQILNSQIPLQNEVLNFFNVMSNNTALKGDELKKLFNNLGIDCPQALIDSISNQKPQTQQQMIDLLMRLQLASDEQRKILIPQLEKLGIDMNSALGKKLIEKDLVLPKVKDATPQDKENAQNKVKPLWNSMQGYFNKNPFQLSISQPRNNLVPGSPQIKNINSSPYGVYDIKSSDKNLFKEVNDSYVNDEMITSRSKEYRLLADSFAFQRQLKQDKTYNVINKFDFDYDKLAKSICDQLRNSPIKTQVTVNPPDINVTTSPQINLNGREITSQVLENVDKYLGKTMARKERGL